MYAPIATNQGTQWWCAEGWLTTKVVDKTAPLVGHNGQVGSAKRFHKIKSRTSTLELAKLVGKAKLLKTEAAIHLQCHQGRKAKLLKTWATANLKFHMVLNTLRVLSWGALQQTTTRDSVANLSATSFLWRSALEARN